MERLDLYASQILLLSHPDIGSLVLNIGIIYAMYMVIGFTTIFQGLVEILLPYPSNKLKATRQEYIAQFGVGLEVDVAEDTSGDFRKFVFNLSRVSLSLFRGFKLFEGYQPQFKSSRILFG